MEVDTNKLAKLMLVNELRKQVQATRKDFFAIVDSLKTDDKDNFEQLCSILEDEDLARKFMIFQENRNQKIRKDILDSTNNIERNILKLLEDINITLKDGIEFQALLK